jgi:hypothetical protein
MNLGDVFNGFRVDWIVRLPAGQSLVLGYFLDASIELNNHNIFRLDKDGNVVWQVQRDEQGKLNWDALNAYAQEAGEDGARWPFEHFLVVQPDGTRKRGSQDGRPLKVDHWVPGCKVRMNQRARTGLRTRH